MGLASLVVHADYWGIAKTATVHSLSVWSFSRAVDKGRRDGTLMHYWKTINSTKTQASLCSFESSARQRGSPVPPNRFHRLAFFIPLFQQILSFGWSDSSLNAVVFLQFFALLTILLKPTNFHPRIIRKTLTTHFHWGQTIADHPSKIR